MFLQILGYIFLGIFALAGLLALISLVYSKLIDEWYRKKLFVVLIVEVVGVVIVLFKQSGDKLVGETNHELSSEDWVALTVDSAKIINPILTIQSQEKTTDTLGKEAFAGEPYLEGILNGSGLQIRNGADQLLGKLSVEMLENTGLYNTIKTAIEKREVSATDDYALVKWEKDSLATAKWNASGEYLSSSPYKLIVYEKGKKVHYRIDNTDTDENFFRSEATTRQLFDVDGRIIHFIKHENQFFLMRIVEARLFRGPNQEGPFVPYIHVLQIRLTPAVEGG